MRPLGLVTPEGDRVAVLVELVRVADPTALDLAEDLRFADGEQAPRFVSVPVAERQRRGTDQGRRREVRTSPAGGQGGRVRLGDFWIPTSRRPRGVRDEVGARGLAGLTP